MQNSRRSRSQHATELAGLRLRVARLESANRELQEQLRQRQQAEELLRQSEEQLRETKDRYRALFESANAAVFVENLDDQILDVNPRACAMLGYMREELLALKVTDLVAPDHPNLGKGIVRNELLQYTAASVETYNLRRDGTLIPVEVGLSRVGDTGLVLVIVQDISERRRAEAMLKESEARYRSLFEDSPISLWEEDTSGVKKILDALKAAGVSDFRAYLSDHPEVVVRCARAIKVLNVNQATLKLFKYDRKEDLTVKVDQEIEAGQNIEGKFTAFREELVARAEGQLHIASEGTQYTLTGEPFYALVSVTVAPGYEDTWAKVFVSIVDLTESRRAQETLRESEAQLRMITDNMVDTVSQVDNQRRIVYVSPSIQRVYGYTPQDILGRPISDLVHPDDIERILIHSRQAIAQKAPSTRLEYRYRHANGEYLWVESATRFLYNEQGVYDGAIFASRDITARKMAEQERQKQVERLWALREIDRAVASSLDLKITLDILLAQVAAQLKVDAAGVMLYDPSIHMLRYAAWRGFTTGLVEKIQLKIGQSYAGQAAMTRKMVLVQDLSPDDPGSSLSLFSQEGFKLYCGLPLVAKGQLKGVLEVFHRSVLPVEPDWMDFLEILAGQAAIAIDTLQMLDSLQHAKQELELAYDTTIEGWARALDLRDQETEGHSRRVMELTVRLARAMNIPEEEMIHIYRGALLHDIGKVAVPDEILLKPSGLTEAEWVLMRQHPVYAYKLLSPVSYLREAMDIPYCHHEKWDGSGYPRGLAGSAIPIAARIFAVIDVWDALTHDRPYRPAWTREQAMNYIREQAGTHFDPAVVDVVLSAIISGDDV